MMTLRQRQATPSTHHKTRAPLHGYGRGFDGAKSRARANVSVSPRDPKIEANHTSDSSERPNPHEHHSHREPFCGRHQRVGEEAGTTPSKTPRGGRAPRSVCAAVMEDGGLVTPWTVLAALLAASTAVALLVTHLVRKAPPLATNGKQAAGGAVRRTSSAPPQSYPNGRLDIYFGSQTGTAEGFAKALAKEAARYGFEGQVVDLETFEPAKLQATSVAVFLLATYGEGDPTDNAMQFAKWLKDEDGELSEQALGGLRFAVFGLGSTQYEHYNKMGKVAFQRLTELGALPVVELGLGDELTVEEDFEKWSEGLWGPLSRAAGEMGRSDSVSIVEPLEASHTDTELDFSLLFLPAAKNGKPLVPKKLSDAQIQSSTKFFFHHQEVPVVTNRELRTPLDGGSTRHIELDLAGTGLTYQTADNLAVLPENCAAVVESVARAQDYPLDAVFELIAEKATFPTPCTVREALTRYLDLSGIPRRTTLAALANFAQEPREAERLRQLASKQGREEYNDFVVKEGRSLAELLTETFPSLRLPLNHLVALAPHLQPRYYTISSSASVHPTQVHATVAVTRDEPRPGRVHLGVCSSFLANSSPPAARVRVFIRPSSFRLPADAATPIILVGPGTGIAPMRALLQERQHQRAVRGLAVGETLLFFGCRRRETDFLYEAELMAFARDGTLSDLQLAFSREKAEKVYVQHLLQQPETARKLWALLSAPTRGAHVYVCGGTSMGQDVHRAFVAVAEREGKKSAQAAADFVKGLQQQGRYVQELWSA